MAYTPSPAAMRKRTQRARRFEKGFCISCGNLALPDSAQCGRCEEEKEDRLAALAERKKNGCRRCGKPPVPGRKFCQRHLEYMRAANTKRERRPQTNGDS